MDWELSGDEGEGEEEVPGEVGGEVEGVEDEMFGSSEEGKEWFGHR